MNRIKKHRFYGTYIVISIMFLVSIIFLFSEIKNLEPAFVKVVKLIITICLTGILMTYILSFIRINKGIASERDLASVCDFPFFGVFVPILPFFEEKFKKIRIVLDGKEAVYQCQRIINNSPNWEVFRVNYDFKTWFYEISHENMYEIRKILRHLLLYRIKWEANAIGEMLVSDIASSKKIKIEVYKEITEEKISPLRELIEKLEEAKTKKDVYQIFYKALDPV